MSVTRRILTTTAGDVASDGEPSDVLMLNGCRVVRLWQTERVPASLPVTSDTAALVFGTMPKDFCGTRFYTAELPAGARIPLHAAQQIDYITVVSGRLTLILESAEVELAPGDTLVQCGNMHGWENRAEETCLLSVVAIAARTTDAPAPQPRA